MLLLTLLLLVQTPASAPEIAPTRCIIHYDGQHRLCGTLLGTDEKSVQIEGEDGETHVIPIPRIVGIEYLLELPAPTEGIVELIDGRQLRGLLKHDSCDTVEIMMHGVPIDIKRTRISRVWTIEPVEERYETLKLSMPIERAGAHLALCRWLIAEKAWNLAVPELEAHIAAHRSAQAVRMLRVARAHQHLSSSNSDKKDGPRSSKTDTPTGLQPVEKAAVNLIRVYELDLNDPPPLRISGETRQAFLDAYNTSTLLPQTDEGRAALMASEPLDILKLMFAHRAREFYGRVEVLNEPVAIRRFRQSVHDLWLIPRCGNTACHGGPDAGRFQLVTGNPLDDRIRTSNLLILDDLVLDGQPLINWNEPIQSTLIQYALPRTKAARPHPAVSGWRPAMDATQSVSALGTVNWIKSMMRSPRPIYPIEPPTDPSKRVTNGPRLPR
jgi:hypothetical protein